MNNIWNELSEESKEYILEVFNDLEPVCANDLVQMNLMDKLFGKENLNPKPQIKTWQDVVKQGLVNLLAIRESATYASDVCDEKIGNKVEATIKIAKLIELGYGGMITDEEWKDCTVLKYYIGYDNEDDTLVKDKTLIGKVFIAFRTKEQRDEFFENNEQLCKDYYMV